MNLTANELIPEMKIDGTNIFYDLLGKKFNDYSCYAKKYYITTTNILINYFDSKFQYYPSDLFHALSLVFSSLNMQYIQFSNSFKGNLNSYSLRL